MTNFPLRLPDHVLEQARLLAGANGTSLNQFIGSLVAERIGELNAMAEMEKRIARANPEAVKAVLARVPDVPPLPGDEILTN